MHMPQKDPSHEEVHDQDENGAVNDGLRGAAAHPFGAARLADDDLSVDFGPLTQPGDRVALVATQPLTTGEAWAAMAPGELRVFVDGQIRRPA